MSLLRIRFKTGGINIAKKYERKTLTLPDGSRKDIYAKTPEELEAKVLEARIQLRAGINLGENPLFGEFAATWYTTEKKPHIKSKTQEYYRNVLNNHILPYLGNIPIRDIKPMQIAAVMNKLNDKSKELNRKTLQILRAIFNSAVNNSLIMKSPVSQDLQPGGVEGKKTESLSREQERLLLEALEGTRAYSFVFTDLQTGMRRGELCGLKWDCVDLTEGVIFVRRNLVFNDDGTSTLNEYPKTDCSIRDLPITPALEIELRMQKEKSTSDFVFPGQDGQQMTRSSFRALWECVNRRKADPSKKAQYGSVKRCIDFKVTPHKLRHTYLTRCFENGLDLKEVQYLAGHATPELTVRIYLHYQKEERKKETFKKVKRMELV